MCGELNNEKRRDICIFIIEYFILKNANLNVHVEPIRPEAGLQPCVKMLINVDKFPEHGSRHNVHHCKEEDFNVEQTNVRRKKFLHPAKNFYISSAPKTLKLAKTKIEVDENSFAVLVYKKLNVNFGNIPSDLLIPKFYIVDIDRSILQRRN